MALTKGTMSSTNAPATGIIINYSLTYGEDPQPLYEAGSSEIHAVLRMESMLQLQVSKAMFNNGDAIQSVNGIQLIGAPSKTIQNPAIKYTYSASSGQVYVVENFMAIGKEA